MTPISPAGKQTSGQQTSMDNRGHTTQKPI